jgi:MYXO-CTERM domain-containing protein
MRSSLGLGLLAFTLTALVGPSLAYAATANCMSPTGSCEVSNDGEDFTECACADGTGIGGGGGNDWAGLSEVELQPICEEQLANLCGPPPLPDLMCSNRLGECTISNDPVDFVECTCASGEDFSGGGGMMWAGLSDEELLLECEAQLDEGCAAAETTGEPSDTGDTGDTGAGETTDSGGADTEIGTGPGPGDTGIDDSGGASEGSTSGNPDPSTTGDDPTGASEDGGGDGGGGGGGGCSVAGRSTSGGWALVLLGLLGLGRRQRSGGTNLYPAPRTDKK